MASSVWVPQHISPGFTSCVVTAPTSLNGGQPNFAQCLAVSWAGTLSVHFWGLLPCNGILPGAKLTLSCVAFSYIGSITARHSNSGRELNCGVEQRAPPIFGRAAITLSFGPHSSFSELTHGVENIYLLLRLACQFFQIAVPSLIHCLKFLVVFFLVF